MSKTGICHLCGNEMVRLTKDHFPPQCALNELGRRVTRLDTVVTLAMKKRPTSGEPVRSLYYEIQPDKPITGGIYKYTQCGVCNSKLGEYYDPRFGEWCHSVIDNLKPGGTVIVLQDKYTLRCRYPLSILKRIVAMFFSINGDKFAQRQPELSNFVRDKRARNLPDKFRLFICCNIGDIIAHIPLQWQWNMSKGTFRAISQIVHPPFVYVMILNADTGDSTLSCDFAPPDSRLTEITDFAQFDYDDAADVDVELHNLPAISWVAGDYRTSGKVIPDDVSINTTEIPPYYYRLVDLII